MSKMKSFESVKTLNGQGWIFKQLDSVLLTAKEARRRAQKAVPLGAVTAFFFDADYWNLGRCKAICCEGIRFVWDSHNVRSCSR